MKLIKPSYEIIEQVVEPIIVSSDVIVGPEIYRYNLIHSVCKQIERAGRTCYKSEDKITNISAEDFVNRMINSGHGAMLEHGTVYLRYDFKAGDSSNHDAYRLWEKYADNIYSVAHQVQNAPKSKEGYVAITTNYRVLVENNWLADLQYICESTEYHEKRVTVKFTCDRGVSHEFVRHRVFSFAQESTRYCNYSKDKFGNELTFIIPCWCEEQREIHYTSSGRPDELEDLMEHFGKAQGVFYFGLLNSEVEYFSLLKKGWKPQQARAILPNALKTELLMTGTLSQWEGFFKLRDDDHAHPQARELAEPLHREFIEKGWVK